MAGIGINQTWFLPNLDARGKLSNNELRRKLLLVNIHLRLRSHILVGLAKTRLLKQNLHPQKKGNDMFRLRI